MKRPAGAAVTPSCWSSRISRSRSRSPTNSTSCRRGGSYFEAIRPTLRNETQVFDQHLGVSSGKLI